MKMIICNLCGKNYLYDRKKRSTQATCHTCMNVRHRWHLKAMMIEYKGGCCQLCGYNKCRRSLQFHHINPSTKLFNMSNQFCISWNRMRDELDKTICLCSNCHTEVENALELIQWGHPQPILDKVNEIHNAFVPIDMEYHRHDWAKYHPKYAII